MANLTPLPETRLAGKNAVVTFGVAPTTWAGDIQDGSYTISYETAEMTNNTSGGFYEDIGTVGKTEFDFTVVWNATTPPEVVEGNMYPLVIEIPSGPYWSGNVRIVSAQYQTMDVKGGVIIQYRGNSQAGWTTTPPTG